MSNNRLVPTLLACAALCAVVSNPATAAENYGVKYLLRYQFQAGESVYFTVHSETSRKFGQGDSSVPTRDGNDSLKHYRVLSVDENGVAEMELTIDQTRMFAEQGKTVFRYDSKIDRRAPEGFEALQGTIGRPWLHMTVSARGETSNAATPQGLLVVESHDFLSRVLPVLPEGEIAIGETWRERFTADVPDPEVKKRPVKLLRKYTLSKVDDGIATIDLKTEMITANLTPEQQASVVNRMYDGTIRFDIAKGMYLGRELKIDQTVIGFAGPATTMSLQVVHRDQIAPAGAATVIPQRAESLSRN
jgi:hypothetical protein